MALPMWEPDLPANHFTLDHVLTKERVIDADDWVCTEKAERVGNSFKIVGSRKVTFNGRIPKIDLSSFNGLALLAANQSQSPLLVGIKLVHGADRDPRLVSLSGGREELKPGDEKALHFPQEVFGTYGFPAGWSQIREVEVTFSVEKGAPMPRSIQVSIGPLEALAREIPPGPRLSQEGLRCLLVEDIPGVTSFFDRPQAHALKDSLKTHYSSEDLGLLIPPPHSYPKDTAEQILHGQIMGQQIGYPVEWKANPIGELEWRHFLHRQHFFREFVKEYVNTGDHRYVAALDGIISSWIHASPVPVGSNGGAGPSWETLSAAWRLREWLWVIGIAWPNESFRPKTKIEMLCSVWEHARSLMDHKGHPNNWIIVESAALALAGLCFPQFKEASQWVKTSIERLRDEFQRQFFSDGVHFEISPLYHSICVHALLEVRQVAVTKGINLPEEFHSPLEKCFEYLAALCRPDFTWPSLNDSGGISGDYTALMSLAGEVFHRADFAWIGSRGACGAPPDQASRNFPDAGIAAMRSDNSRQANFLVFRAGPPGASHIHEDFLSLDVTALGRPCLVDPGITSYAPGPMTDYYRSASAHNVILIDGKGPDRSLVAFQDKIKPSGTGFHWTCQHDVQSATGICTVPRLDGTQPGRESLLVRTVVFVRGEYWVVRGFVTGDGSHEITACWQFFPGQVEIDGHTQSTVWTDAAGAGLELIPLLGKEEWRVETTTGSQHPPRGWVSMNGRDVPATACQYAVRANLPITMFWLLLPFPAEACSGVKATRTDKEEGGVVVEITRPDGAQDSLAFPHTP